MNHVSLVGRIAKDPEIKVTNSDVKYVRFLVAVDRQYNSEQTNFIPVVAWRNQADFVERFLDKGALISVEGYFSSYSYVNENNQNIWRYEVSADKVNSLETKSQAEQRRSVHASKTNESSETTNLSKDNIKFEEEQKKADEKEEEIPWELDL